MTPDRLPLTPHGFFVTGTDTGVGKTLIACALMHALARRNLRVVGMKPVAAGRHMVSGRVVNEDVVALEAASTVEAPRELVNPYCFAPPIAPHIAAAEAGVTIDLERLSKAYAQLASLADCVIVEGAGGFRVPLGAGYDTADLAVRLQLPVVLVVGVRLGCINHAVLTAAAVERAGLPFAGWIANHIDPHMTHATQNVETLRERLRAPLLGRVSYRVQPAAADAAEGLDIDALFSSPCPDA
jgi:dethiobiotin synthetase